MAQRLGRGRPVLPWRAWGPRGPEACGGPLAPGNYPEGVPQSLPRAGKDMHMRPPWLCRGAGVGVSVGQQPWPWAARVPPLLLPGISTTFSEALGPQQARQGHGEEGGGSILCRPGRKSHVLPGRSPRGMGQGDLGGLLPPSQPGPSATLRGVLGI